MESSYLVMSLTAHGDYVLQSCDTLRAAKLAYEANINLGFNRVYVTKVIAEYHG